MNNDLYTGTELVKLIFNTGAVSVWDHTTGPVFWYAAGVPGPFYVNTEKLIGSDRAEKLLGKITNICKTGGNAEQKSSSINDAVMEEYRENDVFRKTVLTLLRKSVDIHGIDYDFISGGERRDWFFSVPIAHEAGLDHVYLFKDKTIFCEKEIEDLGEGNKVLHISDLVHNASSYFDNWIPILQKNGFNLIGAMSVINRGNVGIDRLSDHGIKNATLKGVNMTYFKELEVEGQISPETLNEIVLYFTDQRKWATQYILANKDLFGIDKIDNKSLDRLRSFVENDPWNIRKQSEDLFDTLEQQLQLNG